MPKIIETLEQGEWWYGQDSFPYRVVEMDTEHIGNVLRWLRRRANQLRMQHHWDEFLEHHDLPDEDAGPESELAFVKWLGASSELDVDPHAWLEQRPLVKALKYTLIMRDTLDADVVDVHTEEEIEDDSGTHARAVGADPGLRDRPALG